MGSDVRFTAVLVAWLAGLGLALFAFVWTVSQPDLNIARLVALAGVVLMAAGLVQHVRRTNVAIAGFVEALRVGDFAMRSHRGGGAGFDRLGEALDGAMRRLQTESQRNLQELRFLEALIDDMPVALLTSDSRDGARLVNRAARRLFGPAEFLDEEALAAIGATFARRVREGGQGEPELMLLRLDGSLHRAIVRAGTLERLGFPIRAVSVEPVQTTLDAIEIAVQSDLVRVLTHEILNSLTPVTSLAGTAAQLLDCDDPDVGEARLAVGTLARRAEGLQRFIDSYRTLAHPPVPRIRRFAAEPFAAELARLFAAEWPDHRLLVEAGATQLAADPDLLAQALINLLRNAAQAPRKGDGPPTVRLSITERTGAVLIDVEDDGSGIPEPLRGDVFLPFFTTRSKGTGIGLNLVRQIVVGHGWTIELSTSQLGGACFRIRTDRR
ncbi:sensor histidine kinase [Altericroceibacterium xinjiangense]|uniref:sensor histidine kinase n=1 Tax=Altericroceibacterium xinjiangense TaxID=762261 RepID=UPI000F7ECF93|nr:ATP-binding protein [Altericroceibacterium xinjiangense]